STTRSTRTRAPACATLSTPSGSWRRTPTTRSTGSRDGSRCSTRRSTSSPSGHRGSKAPSTSSRRGTAEGPAVTRVASVGTLLRALTRPAFSGHGRKVIAFFCGWEILAIIPGSPIPTISEVVDRHPWFGVVLLLALAHHWFLEADDEEIATVA